ncbi:MAG: hypothetical protein HDKAJFGB_04082 [Anaerolineae bacterium]|nr:hypothetical protein [Anaerolineae bacterium]
MCNPSPGLSPQRTKGDKPTTTNPTNIPKRNQPPTSKDKETSEKKQNPKPTQRTTKATVPRHTYTTPSRFPQLPEDTPVHKPKRTPHGPTRETKRPKNQRPPSAHLHTTPRIKKKQRNPHPCTVHRADHTHKPKSCQDTLGKVPSASTPVT